VPWSRRLQEKPTLTAVSKQSPVRVHILMPASLIDLIVSVVLSYNTSSIAVAPRSVKSFSIS
jgi:hypothetical protein